MGDFRILYVEDEPNLREIYGFKLKNYFNCEVITLESGNKASNLLKNDSRFSIIISDFSMADGSGLDLLYYILNNNLKIPFVFFTMNAQIKNTLKFDQQIDFVLKFDFEELCKVVSQKKIRV
jgi:DNA-binding NtrC family response regulator